MGYSQKQNANVFAFLKGNAKETYSLIEIYSNSDGELKPKTFYNSKNDIGGQIMSLKNSQPFTSETRTRPSDVKMPAMLFKVSNRFADDKDTQKLANDQIKEQKKLANTKKM
jgi:hypothetical protein